MNIMLRHRPANDNQTFLPGGESIDIDYKLIIYETALGLVVQLFGKYGIAVSQCQN